MNDVKKMVESLVNDLGISEGHIQCLLSTSSDTPNLCIGPEECRAAVAVTSPIRIHIIDTLLTLSARHEIDHGDNISSTSPDTGHAMTFKIQAFMTQAIFQLKDPSKPYAPWTVILPLVPILASLTLATEISPMTILTEISRTKGRNITVILDCCYSAGNTRGPPKVARHATPLPPTSVKDMLEAAHTRLRHLLQYRSVFKGD